MTSILTSLITFAFCETIEERVARYRTAGLSEAEIDKLLLDIPEGFKSGQKLFTQDDVTKFRNDERRKVEANFKGQVPVTPPVTPTTVPPVDLTAGQPNPPSQQTPPVVPQVGLTQEQIAQLVQDSIKGALDAQKNEYEQTITGLKANLDNVANAYNADKQKAFDNRKAVILAELPATVHNLLVGDNIEALEASYASIKAVLDTVKQEAQQAVTATEATKQHETTVFYKADDGTEYLNIQSLVANPAHLSEWKAKQSA